MGCEISQAESLHFAQKGWFRSSCCDFAAAKLACSLVQLISNGYNFFISAPIMHLLKRWTPDFLSFETTYSMHEMDSRKYSKCVQELLSSCPLEFLHVRFLSLFLLLAFMICFWQRTKKLQSLDSSCKWASICFAMDSKELSLILDCFGDKKAIKNTKT